jgi:hypothetical protein
MHGHPLMGQSYAGKIIVYDTDIFSTGGALGLYFKSRITHTGPLALICRTVHKEEWLQSVAKEKNKPYPFQ